MKSKHTIISNLSLLAGLMLIGCSSATLVGSAFTTLVDYSSTYVPEEGGITFVKLTDESQETITEPNARRNAAGRLEWWTNPMIAMSPDGERIAFNVFKNDRRNIFVRNVNGIGASTQRTFRERVNDVCFSPDGETICFSEVSGDENSYVFTTNALQGSVVQQKSSQNVQDYGPCYSPDGSKIFFTRKDKMGFSIWSYDVNNMALSNYCRGINPVPINGEEFLCVRENSSRNYELWIVNYAKGTESIILSQADHSFTTASLSPDGKWIVCTSNSLPGGKASSENLDIYVVRLDGSQLTQLTYHHGHDCSPVWSSDGKKIYFLSQRGTQHGEYNIWSMDFNL